MSGISEIIKTEAQEKRLERLLKVREFMLPNAIVFDQFDLTSESGDFISRIKDKFNKNNMVPQNVDIETF